MKQLYRVYAELNNGKFLDVSEKLTLREAKNRAKFFRGLRGYNTAEVLKIVE